MANDTRPDVQLHMCPFSFAIDYGLGLAKSFSIPHESYHDMIGKLHFTKPHTVHVC